MDVIYKKLKIQDWQKYKDLYLEWLKNEPQATGLSYEEEVKLSDQDWKEYIEKFLSNPKTIVYIAKKDNEFVGTVCSIREHGEK